MKPNPTIQQSKAYGPMRAIVEGALEEAAQESNELRNLLLKSAVLRHFDAALLSTLAGRPEKDSALLDDVTSFMPAEEIEGRFYYDEFARQTLLHIASEESQELLGQASQAAADYYRGRARQAEKAGDIVRSHEHDLQALYYQLLADPEKGFDAWQRAWDAVFIERADYGRQAELIRVADDAWDSLADAPAVRVEVLRRKGWLAYFLGDWQGAIDTFHRLLERDPLEPVIQADAMVGLGYAHFRRGTLALAAEHFREAEHLIDKNPSAQDGAALIRAKALCGLGEVCTRIGAPEGILLRRLLLPKEEQRKALAEYDLRTETPPLEDWALARLLGEADKLFTKALDAVAGLEAAEGDRLRILAQQALLYLEQGDWERAQAEFQRVRFQELARLGAEDEESRLLAKEPRIAERLARINLYLGDCCLLAAQVPALTDRELPLEPISRLIKQVRPNRFLERVVERREAELDSGAERASDERLETRAQTHYVTAWSLWKMINMREGMALSLSRRGDAAALRPQDPVQRENALHLYTTSLELYEQQDSPGEVARTQEQIEWLLARARPPEEQGPAADEGTSPAESPVELKEPVKQKQTMEQDRSWQEFRAKVENVLAHRPRFFRYRIARKLELQLRLWHRLIATLFGLLVAALVWGWLAWLVTPWLSRISARVTGLPWALPALGISWLVALTLLGLVQSPPRLVPRLAVRMIRLRSYWLGQDKVTVDDAGLHLYDHAGQLRQSIRWRDIWQVRSQTWEVSGVKGSRAAVFGPAGQEIRFDHHLHGYRRLMESIKSYIMLTGRPDRWQEPKEAYLEGMFGFFAGAMVLNMAAVLACPLTAILALIPAITRFGPICLGAVAVFAAFTGLVMAITRSQERRYMHPRREEPGSAPERSAV